MKLTNRCVFALPLLFTSNCTETDSLSTVLAAGLVTDLVLVLTLLAAVLAARMFFLHNNDNVMMM